MSCVLAGFLGGLRRSRHTFVNSGVTGWWVMCVPTLRRMGQELRVDIADVHDMAAQWGVSAAGLDKPVAPTGLGLACQTSAAAVDFAHINVAAFTARLAARIGERAMRVTQVDTNYLTQEAFSAAAVTALDPLDSE